MQAPSIFEHTTLGAYLARHYQYKKSMNPSFSYQVWARKLKVRTPSSICMVVKGRRLPSRALAQKLKMDLGLDDSGGRYFDLLVDCKRLDQDGKGYLLHKKLEELQPSKGFRLIRRDEFQLISKWIHYALLEMVELKGFKEDPEWITRQLHFDCSVSEVIEAIEVLKRLGLVARDKKGKLKRVPGRVRTGNDFPDEALKIFHEQSLGNAARAIRKFRPTEREVSGLTLCMRQSQLPSAKKKLRAFLEEFCMEFDCASSADSIFQLELALFPLARPCSTER